MSIELSLEMYVDNRVSDVYLSLADLALDIECEFTSVVLFACYLTMIARFE